MTLEEGKRKVLMLLDEYSSGGEITQDIDINNKMNDFFDMAQKDMAQYQPIVALSEIELDPDEKYTDLPSNFCSYYRTWKDGKQINNYPIIGGKMFTNGADGEITLEYFKNPTTISTSTPNTYVFEVNEAAANCLPYYVASQQLIVDLVVDYSALWQMYERHKALLRDNLSDLSGNRVAQRLFGGRG